MAAAKTLNLLTFDAAYLRSLQKRDPLVEYQFVAYFTPLVHGKLRKHLRSPQLIEEAAQETFARVLAAVRARRGVRHPERFGAFVQAVCGNVALEMLRRESRFVALDEAEAEAKYEIPASFRSPQSLAEAAEAREIVRRVLAHLPEFDRQLLQAVFLDEEDRPDLCERFEVSEGYLRVLVHRAKARFLQQTKAEMKKREAAARRASMLALESAATAG